MLPQAAQSPLPRPLSALCTNLMKAKNLRTTKRWSTLKQVFLSKKSKVCGVSIAALEQISLSMNIT